MRHVIYKISSFFFLEKTASVITPERIEALPGDYIKFTCLGTGKNFKTMWTLKDNLPLPVHVKVNGPVLYIESAFITDTSLYVCHVWSTTGKSESIAELIVRGRHFGV